MVNTGARPLTVTIIGNTSWGNTLGNLLANNGATVKLWTRYETEAEELNREEKGYFFTSSMAEALEGADLVVWAVPSQRMRWNVIQAKDYLTDSMVLVSAAKGLEAQSGMRMSEVIAEEIAPPLRDQICVLSGPNLAKEIAQGLPAASVIAARNPVLAEKLRGLLESPNFFLFSSDDVVGVELSGAFKNIIALGAGMIDGLGLGDNAKSAFMTLGWAELVSLGVSLGAKENTFYGLAGLGDLIATCSSQLSRNHYVGFQLAKGRNINDITASMPHVAEGITTTLAAQRLAQRQRLNLSIVNAIYEILYRGVPPNEIMTRFKELVTSHR
jgi:glycerol-3-phosphate dehydrogenase (NAD(P)+)